MAIELICQGCGERLRVPEEHLGKRARCPKCQALSLVEGSSPSVAADLFPNRPTFAPTSAGEETWQVKLEDGRTFGPVSRSELNQWQAEGRISPRTQTSSTLLNRWQWAGELYPELGIPLPTRAALAPAPAANPFSDALPNPYAAPQSYGQGQLARGQEHRGGLILTLGLLSMFFCALLGPFAVIMGHSDLRAMNAGSMDNEGYGLTISGTILGWMGTAQLALVLFIFFVAIVGALAGQ